MNHGGAAGILVGTHRGDQRGNAGADVLTHDNGNGTAVGDHAGGAQRLQNTHAGAGALDDGRYAQTQKETFERAVGQLAQDLLQLAAGLLFQRLAHDVHTEQEQGQATQQGKYIKNSHLKFLALFDTFI